MKLLTTNLVTENATTVTASTSNPSFPASNLKHPFRSKRYRSTSNSSVTVVFDFVTTEAVNTVVLLWPKEEGIKLSGSAIIKIQANATNIWTTPAVDVTLTVDNSYSVASHHFTTDQSYRYWRLYVHDPLSAWNYIELGTVWIGKSLSIENAQNGFTFEIQDLSKTTSTAYGHEYVDEYPQRLNGEFNYSLLDYTAVQTLENAYRTNGSKKPVLLIVDPTQNVFNKNHFLLYGKLGNRFGVKHINYNLFDVGGLRIEELS